MPKSPREPTNLVLEQLRLMRGDMNARFDKISARFDQIDARFNKVDEEVTALKKEIRGIKLNGIAEIYKANLTVASFVDLQRRVEALERKSS